jgi:iron(III) transport system permease protein
MKSASISRSAGALLAALILALPLLTLLGRGLRLFSAEILLHLWRTVIPGEAARGALVALLAALFGAALSLGGLSASLFDFPGRAARDRLLLAPLLLPAWFLAVTYRELADARGILWLGLVLGVAAAPLFHLLGGAALRDVPAAYGDLLRLQGRGGPASLARLLLPLGAPALAAAAALGALAAWSDAASARTLAVRTLAVGMLDQWTAREDASVGALLGLTTAAVSLAGAGLLLAWVARLPFHDDARLGLDRHRRAPLRGAWALAPWLLALPQLALGVLVPAGAILTWSAQRLDRANLATLGADAARTLLLAVAATLLAAALALPIVRAEARAGERSHAWSLLALLPFALPATVLAAAVLWMVPAAAGPALALHDTLLPLVMALGVHLSAVFVGAGQAALARRGRDHEALLRVLGRDRAFDFVALLRPFLARPVAAAAAFVFLECLKDVNLTVVLSPFGFQSISARVFQLAQIERVRDTAVWMLCLALVGLYPLMTLSRLGDDPSA